MWTIKYKGFYIHGYVDKDECRVQAPSDWTFINRVCASLKSAKAFITRSIRENAGRSVKVAGC